MSVYSIAVQADGKILAGGFFTSIGGQTRNSIARLDATTGLADSFDPNANSGVVYSIAVQADGKILVGGYFTSIGGQTRNRIARLDPTTGLADSFDPNANGNQLSIQSRCRRTARFWRAAISPASADRRATASPGSIPRPAWLIRSTRTRTVNVVLSIAVQADGKILAGGYFTSIGGQTRNDIARLDATTGLADSFNPNANGAVYSIAVQADGKILAGGIFTSIGGQTRNRIARLETDGRLDQTLNLSTVGDVVLATAVQPDGKILIGGKLPPFWA